jgi:hypothetical protein
MVNYQLKACSKSDHIWEKKNVDHQMKASSKGDHIWEQIVG